MQAMVTLYVYVKIKISQIFRFLVKIKISKIFRFLVKIKISLNFRFLVKIKISLNFRFLVKIKISLYFRFLETIVPYKYWFIMSIHTKCAPSLSCTLQLSTKRFFFSLPFTLQLKYKIMHK